MRFLLVAIVLILGPLGFLSAVPPESSLAYVYPAGAAQGTEVIITVTGQNLRGTDAVLLSGDGVTARVVGYVGGGGPLNQVQQEALKDYLQARNKGDSTIAPPSLPDLPALKDLASRSKEDLQNIHTLFLNNDKKARAPMNELVYVALTLTPEARPGNRELRLVTPLGPTNPLVFQVGILPEVSEAGPLQLPDARRYAVDRSSAVLNGQIMPGETDLWSIPLNRGARVMVAAQARNLIPYIADAVPGWFQPVITVLDPTGKEVAWADDHGSDPDPVLEFVAPVNGTYSLQIRDSIYRGRYDFVYRVAVGNPKELAQQLPQPSLLGVALVIPPSEEAALPPSRPVALTVGQTVTGVLAKPGQVAQFSLTGKAGESFRAGVLARRSGSALDGVLRLLDATGKVVALNDDYDDKSAGVFPHHADPRLLFKLPADGTFRLELFDSSGLGGPEYRYALTLDRPQPDFFAITKRSGLGVPAGGTIALPVVVQRRDGWLGDVEIRIAQSPQGFQLKGGRIPADQDSVMVTISVPATAKLGLVEFSLEAVAEIEGTRVVRPIQAADLRMQAFGNTHLVPAGGLKVVVLKRLPKDVTWGALPEGGLTWVAGQEVILPLKVALDKGQSLEALFLEAPQGFSLPEVRMDPSGPQLVFKTTSPLPVQGNLVVDLTLVVQNKDKDKPAYKTPLGNLPALPYKPAKP